VNLSRLQFLYFISPPLFISYRKREKADRQIIDI